MPALSVPQAFDLAVEHHGAGRLAEAEALYRQILATAPNHAGARHHLGILAQQAGRNDLAEEWIGQAITMDPGNAAAYGNLGEVYRRTGRLDEAVAHFHRALELQPDRPEVLNNLAVALRKKGRTEEALAACRRALVLKPNSPETHSNLGNVLADGGHMEEALAAYRRALELNPNDANAHYNLAKAFEERGQFDEAITHFRQMLALRRDFPPAYNDLGNLLSVKGQLAEAMTAYRGALGIKPGYPPALLNIGNLLKGQGLLDEAVLYYRRAIESKPDYAEAHNNLGNVFNDRGQLDEAIAAYRQTLVLRPNLPDTHTNLGNALKDRGQLDEAIATYRRAIELAPERAELRSNLIYGLQFYPGLEQETVIEEQRWWNQHIGDPLKQFVLPHTNERDPERRLRIGYVSPDFRDHAVAFFLAPLLEAHDRRRFEIYGYSNVARPDPVTTQLRQSTDVWREVRYLSDAQFTESIRQDGIDILVDLTSHTSDNRLPTFARKPAPVQVSWLGLPGSSGLEAIDYWLTDRFLDPADEEPTDRPGRPFRLPDAWCCCLAPNPSPQVNALPALQTEAVTFASFNNFAKINDSVLALWARVLNSVPGSRLRLLAQAGNHQERTRAFLEKCGVAPQRCEFLAYEFATTEPGTSISLHRYLEADIALDPFPYNGMTTTCHALWAGVPVVTRTGKSPVSRAGQSLLHTLGLSEWVAHSDEEYVRIAVELAGDLARLAELRATLRTRMTASPLMDAPRFARDMEAAYRTMWRQWCQEEPAR